MKFSIWWRLSVMMFLQYLIWGAWGDFLPVYLDELGIAPELHGWMMGMLYLAALVAPFIGGQVADRYLATEKVLAICHLLGGTFMLMMAQYTDFKMMMVFMILHSLMYIITLPLTNTLCFHHIDNVERDFGWIRVWGTLGWIAAGLILSVILSYSDSKVGCLYLSGGAAIVLGLFSLVLPHTPPKKESTSPLAFLEALKLLKDPSFLIFMIISFFVSTELMFYFVLTGPFLSDIGISDTLIPTVLRIAQGAEIITMVVLLPLMLPKLGIKKSMIIGIIAWPIRYIVFAIGHPTWLVVASIALHGFCYVFFFVVGQIYVDRAASKDIRSSAQSLLYFITFGMGLFLGSLFAGYIRAYFTTGVGEAAVTNWTWVFMVPVVLTVLCAVIFVFIFHEPNEKNTEAAVA